MLGTWYWTKNRITDNDDDKRKKKLRPRARALELKRKVPASQSDAWKFSVSQCQETVRIHRKNEPKSQYTLDQRREHAMQCVCVCCVCASRNRTPNYFCVNCCLSRVCSTNLSFFFSHSLLLNICTDFIFLLSCVFILFWFAFFHAFYECKRHFHSKSKYLWSKLHIIFVIVAWNFPSDLRRGDSECVER